MTTNFEKVGEFRIKFGLGIRSGVRAPEDDVFLFRYELCLEELKELLAAHRKLDLVGVADAIADLLYVTYGMAYEYGIPIDDVFAEVHRANMQKVRAKGDDDPLGVRKSGSDVVKPDGFVPPNIKRVLGL